MGWCVFWSAKSQLRQLIALRILFLQLHRKGQVCSTGICQICQMNARLIRQQAKNRVDTARTGVYNLEKSNFRRILHVKCYCNGEKCKVNIAGWTFSVRFSCIVLSEQQVPAAVVIQGRLYGRPVIFALQLLNIVDLSDTINSQICNCLCIYNS